MKTTNIFHKLKASGAYNTDGMKPQLPGLQSPLSLNPEGDKPKKEVKAERIKTNMEAGTRTRYFSKEDQDKYNVPAEITSKITKVKSSMAKKKSCAKFIPEAGEKKPNTRRNKAQKRVNRMLGGLANSNRGCKPHRKIKSR